MKNSFVYGGLIATTCLALFGLFHIAQAQGQSGMDDMAMMKKMMVNRPQSMKHADQVIMKVKKEATGKGMYSCCLKHSCDSCALKMGACMCGKSVSMGKPVCNECKGGWAAGDGAISGVKADEIKTFPRMGMDGKMSMAHSTNSNLVVVRTCPMTGEKVVSAGMGVSLVDNYEVHFCCGGCRPAFDKLTNAQKLQKIHHVIS